MKIQLSLLGKCIANSDIATFSIFMPLLNILKQSTLKNKQFLKRKNKFYKKIGRQTLFLGLALSSLIFLILIPVSIGLYFLINGETNSCLDFLSKYF